MGSPSPNLAERVACVVLPAFPLQLLMHDHPRWRRLPAAVVDEDRPQGKLLWVNEHARESRVLPGMRYAAAQSLASQLRAAVVPRERIDEAVGDLFVALHAFSPRVEPRVEHPGTFWLDPGGLIKLYGSLEQWSAAIHLELSARKFEASVIVGFHRFRTQAIARTHRGFWVVPTLERERKMAEALPLDRLGLPPKLRDELAPLGVRSLGDFLALPREGLRMHFGAEAEALHARASDDHWAPLQPRAFVEAVRDTLELDPPETDDARLLFRIKPLLERLVSTLASRSAAMSALELDLQLERSGAPASAEANGEVETPTDRIRHIGLTPAAPTLDALQILDLIRLRLGALTLDAPIERLSLELEGVRAHARQLALFEARQKRDLDAGSRALARLRASFGDEAVTRPTLRDAHLPEASFLWEPVQTPSFPKTAVTLDGPMPLVRCLFAKHLALPSPPRGYDGWPIGPQRSPMAELHGPYRVSGGWWVKLVERDYYFARTRGDDLAWLYFDRPRRRWFQQGFLD